MRGDGAEAAQWAKRALALDPNAAEAYVLIARADKAGGNHEDARAAYRRYLDLAPRGLAQGRSAGRIASDPRPLTSAGGRAAYDSFGVLSAGAAAGSALVRGSRRAVERDRAVRAAARPSALSAPAAPSDIDPASIPWGA